MPYTTQRTPAAKVRIARMRMMAQEDEAADVGSYLMWLEDRLDEAWGFFRLDEGADEQTANQADRSRVDSAAGPARLDG